MIKLETDNIFHLVEKLYNCNDSKQVLTEAIDYYHRIFGEFIIYAVLLSDNKREDWRLLTLRNPYSSYSHCVNPSDLLSGTDTDTLADEFGYDITICLHRLVEFRQFISEPENAFSFSIDDGSRLSAQLLTLLPSETQSGLAYVWTRPSGGKGCAILGFQENLDHANSLTAFKQSVKLITRLAFFPGYSQYVARMQKLQDSMRRNIVHDLKTPVAVIQGYAETLIALKDDEPQLREELLTGIIEQTDRMLEDLRDILMPLDHHWEPLFEEVDLSLLLHKTVTAEKHTGRAVNHTFVIEGADKPVIVQADKRKMRRVFENLLSNAVKYSPGKNKTVTIRLTCASDIVRIAFKDEGIGMTPEQLNKVMSDVGRVVDQSLGIEGTGFGLESCRKVLEAHNGSLEAVSNRNEGSVFTAVLPIKRQYCQTA